ncbi:MAG: metal ABC transporter ATP-binding protein [Erysipelotrichaceae bacterium]|nr:metal ABC transporter ATP-binding protein [Erysipelotrichaceae bacterium]
MSVIHVEDLTAAYEATPVLWDVDVDIDENSITAIVGPNGAGKSTLLKCILGFVKPLSGSVSIFNNPLKKVLDKLAYVPQHSSVNWDFPITVFDVVLMGRYQSIGWFKHPNKQEKAKALAALEEMKLSELKDRQISQLSGGQRQRVFIARALCQDADLLIMDEPLAGVDKTSERIIMNKVKELKKMGKTIVCVHHDFNTLREYFDHVVLINKYVVASGEINETLTPENIKATYEEQANV